MKEYTLDEYKEELKLSENLLEEICSDAEAFNNKSDKYTITISYDIAEYLLTAIKNTIENKISELKEKIDYYDRHSSWLRVDGLNGLRCDNCGYYSNCKTKFCPSCGFLMDKKITKIKR